MTTALPAEAGVPKPAEVRRSRRAGAAAALLALAAVMAAGLWPLLSGAARPTWDAAAFYAPGVGLIGDFARDGRLLTWDPWVGGGRPAFADPQSGAASPVVILAALVGGQPLGGFLLYWIGSWFLGGVGMLALGRRLGAPTWARLCTAAAFVACGYFTGHGQHTTIVFAYATLPWFVERLDRAMAARSLAAALQAGAVWGLAGLSGYPALVIIHGLFGGAWVLGRALLGGFPGGGGAPGRDDDAAAADGTAAAGAPGGRLRRLLWAPLAWAVVVAVALAVLAPTYTSFFVEGRATTDRTGPLSRYWAVERGPLHLGALITFASPRVSALKTEHPDVYPGEISMAAIYLAPAVLGLALLALARPGPLRAGGAWRGWLLLLAATTFAAALGDLLPVRGWLYDLVPPTRYFRFPALFRGYALFTACVLALEAARDLERRPSRRAWAALGALTAAIGVCALWTAAAVACRTGGPLPLAGWGGWTLIAWLGPAAAALAAAVGGERARRAAIAVLIALALADGVAALRLAEPVMATRGGREQHKWQQVARLHRPQVSPLPGSLHREHQSAWGLEDNRNQATKQAAFGAYDPFRDRYHRAWVRDPRLIGFVTGGDRTWFAPRALPFEKVAPAPNAGDQSLLRVPTPDLERYARRAAEAGGPPPVIHPVPGRAVEGPLAAGAELEELPPMERLPVELVEATPESLELRLVAPADGWLVVTDRWSPSWRATVDGRPAPVHPAAFLFRAIAVEAGRHQVRFELHPAGYRPLVAVSWTVLGAAFLALPALAAWRRRRLAMLNR